MAETTQVLSLLLTARYVGAPAFSAMSKDIDTLARSTSGLAKVGASMSLVGAGLTAVGVGLAVTAVEAIKQASAYQDAIQRMVSVHAIAKDQVTALNQAIMQTSDRFGQNSTDIANGLYYVTSTMNGLGSSLTTNKAVAQDFFEYVIPAMGAMVAASGHGLPGSITWQQAGQDVTHIAAAMNTPVAQWANLMGSMTYVENNAGLTQQQLVQAALRAAPTARELGVSYPDLFAAIGATATAGGYGARAGTELGAGYRQMLANSTSLKALASIGLSPGQFFSNGQLRDTGTILSLIDSRLIGISDPQKRFALQQQIFGAVGNRTFGLLAQPKTLGIYQRLLSGESANPAARMFGVADSQMSSFAGSVAKLQTAFQNFLKTIGGPLLTAVQPWIDRLAGALNRLTSALQSPRGLELLAKAPQILFGGAAFGLTAGPTLQIGGGLLRDFATHQDAKHAAYLKAVERWAGRGEKGLKPSYVPTAGEKLIEELWTKPAKGMMAFGQRFSPLHLGVSALGAAHAGGARVALPKSLPNVGELFGGLKALPKSALGGMLDFFEKVGGAVKVAVPAILSFGSALLPILAVALLVAGAITVGVLAFTRYRKQVLDVAHTFQNAFAPVFKMVREVVLSVLKQIQDAWKSHAKEIDAAMKQLFAAIKSATPFFQEIGYVIGAVIAIIVKVIGYLVSAFIAALPYIIGVFTKIFRFLGDLGNLIQAVIHGKWGDAWKFAKQALADAWGAIKNLLMALWTFISQIFVNLWNDIKGPLGNLWNSVTTWFSNLGKSVQSAFVNALSGLGAAIKNAVIGAIRWALQNLPGGPVVRAALNVVGLGGMVGKNATGGYIDRTMLSWVGEKGPELVLLPGGSRVYSHQDSLNLASPLNTSLSAPLHSPWRVGSSGQQLTPLREELTGLVDAVKALAPQRSPAEEYFFTRNIQREREAVWARYPNTSREFDQTYRRAYQYYG